MGLSYLNAGRPDLLNRRQRRHRRKPASRYSSFPSRPSVHRLGGARNSSERLATTREWRCRPRLAARACGPMKRALFGSWLFVVLLGTVVAAEDAFSKAVRPDD